MIEAVKDIGEYSLEKAGRRLEDPTDIVIEDPDSNGTYKHILGIRVNKTEKGFEYAGIELEEFSKSKIKQYLYKKDASRGTDFMPTGRVTEIDKTFKNKILLWFTNITKENQIVFIDDEIKFLKGLNDCIKSNTEAILSDLKIKYNDLDKKDQSIITLLIYSPDKKYIGDFPVFRRILLKKIKDSGSDDASNKILSFVQKLEFEQLYKNFKLIQDDYYKIDVFIELDYFAKAVWNQYKAIKDLRNPIERKNEFLKIKKDFYEYVISIPKDKAPKPENETGIAYVSIEELKYRYDLETGFIPGSGGTLLF